LPDGYQQETAYASLSQRQYAAIALKVPDSGAPWLDAMIRESLREEAARLVLPVLLAKAHYDALVEDESASFFAKWAREVADALYPEIRAHEQD
jgi:hypothetical protein